MVKEFHFLAVHRIFSLKERLHIQYMHHVPEHLIVALYLQQRPHHLIIRIERQCRGNLPGSIHRTQHSRQRIIGTFHRIFLLLRHEYHRNIRRCEMLQATDAAETLQQFIRFRLKS